MDVGDILWGFILDGHHPVYQNPYGDQHPVHQHGVFRRYPHITRGNILRERAALDLIGSTPRLPAAKNCV